MYTPGAWWVGSLGDHILHLLFGLFDGYESQRGQVEFEPYLDTTLGRMQWGDQEYMRLHLRGIAMRVHAVLNTS